MNDEEYYKCFRIPKQLVDETIEMIADAACLAMNERVIMMVKEEVGNHPDHETLLRYYEDISNMSAQKLAARLLKTTIETTKYAIIKKREDKKREQTGIQ